MHQIPRRLMISPEAVLAQKVNIKEVRRTMPARKPAVPPKSALPITKITMTAIMPARTPGIRAAASVTPPFRAKGMMAQ